MIVLTKDDMRLLAEDGSVEGSVAVIKNVRQRTGCSLREAKSVVDNYKALVKPDMSWSFRATDNEFDGQRILDEACAAGLQAISIQSESGRSRVYVTHQYLERLRNAEIPLLIDGCGPPKVRRGEFQKLSSERHDISGSYWVCLGDVDLADLHSKVSALEKHRYKVFGYK